jgi:Tfp pilus assembly protein PilO
MFEILSHPLPRKQIRRLILVDVCVVLVLVAFPVRIGYLDFQQARREVAAQMQVRDNYLEQLRLARSAESEQPMMAGEIRAAVDQLADRGRRLSAIDDWPVLIQELRQLVDESGLDQATVNTFTPLEGAEYSRHRVALRVEGDFVRILRFLHRLRRHRTYYTVDSVQLQLVDSATRPPRLAMNADLYTVLVPVPLSLPRIQTILADTVAAALPGGGR